LLHWSRSWQTDERLGLLHERQRSSTTENARTSESVMFHGLDGELS
jgi:hypothetical protein